MFLLSISAQLSAASEQRTVTLGDSTFQLVRTSFKDPSHGTYIVVHENEKTAVKAALRHIHKYGGTLFELKAQGKREIMFTLSKTTYLIDPNRIFSEQGIVQTLDLNNYSGWRHNSIALIQAVRSAAARILEYLGPLERLTAVHNNTNQSGSIAAKTMELEGLNLDTNSKAHEYFLVTDGKDFNGIGASGYPVLFQDPKKTSPDREDGSLSEYCGRKGIRYINVEAGPLSLSRQEDMLKITDKVLEIDKGH
jgi:hypothetical protein